MPKAKVTPTQLREVLAFHLFTESQLITARTPSGSVEEEWQQNEETRNTYRHLANLLTSALYDSGIEIRAERPSQTLRTLNHFLTLPPRPAYEFNP